VVSRERRRVVGILRFACVSVVKDIHEKGISRLQDEIGKRLNASMRRPPCDSLAQIGCLMATVLPEVEQLRQAVQTAAALQEIVCHQFRGTGS
jgi:hypothetical protein